MDLFITKASGQKELFSEEKLRNSLMRSGASSQLIDRVVVDIERLLKDGAVLSTSDIYKQAFSLLRREERMVATRYHLKKAVMDMGPSGHPFEHFVGELLRAKGYAVKIAQIVQGACVTHEVDVVAEKDGKRILVECKFHNQQGMKSDVKTALYVQARFEDIKRKCIAEKGGLCEFQEIWLVTNTKLTSDAIQYAECVGMKAIGWSYPDNGSLQDLIESSGLHPVTCLSNLRPGQQHVLLQKNIVLCKQVKDDPSTLKEFNLPESKLKKVLQEAGNIVMHST
ncbi:MAG: restriction endonuclease [Patescibacteria group bacterium]